MKPTFSNGWDRLTYLLGEYRVLVSVLVIGSAAWTAVVQPELPTVTLPAWMGAYAVAWILAAPAAYPIGVKLYTWWRNRRWVTFYHVNAVEDTVKKYKAAPETWAEKTVDGPDPWPVNGGEAWAVREFEYFEDTGDLVVTGVWLAACSDDRLITSKNHMEDIHTWLLGKYLELSAVRDRVHRLGIEVQERVLNAAAEARERGQMLDQGAVEEAIEDAKSDVPTPDESDMPTIDDVVEDDATFQDLSPDADGRDGHEQADTNGTAEAVAQAGQGGEQ